MPSRKISELTTRTNLTGDELIPAAHAGETYGVPINAITSSITKSDIGLSNVNNTSDLDKPISTLTQQALNDKAESTHTHNQYATTDHAHADYAASTHTHSGFASSSHSHAISDVTGLSDALDGKAPIAHTHVNYSLTTHTHTGDQTVSPTTVEIINIATLSHSLVIGNAGKMLRFTPSGAKTLDVSLASTPANTIFHASNRSSSGDVIITFGGGITGNAPKNGTLILEPGDTVSIHFISSTTADIYGSTKAI